MTPEIGPPLAAEAGVSSVWLAPALAGAGVHLSGVMPCTCADALVAGKYSVIPWEGVPMARPV